MPLYRTPDKSMSATNSDSLIDMDDNNTNSGLVNLQSNSRNINENTNTNSNMINRSDDDGSENLSQFQRNLTFLMNKCEQLQTQVNQNARNNNSNSNTQINEPVEVFKVTTKVPPFYSERPDLWFHQVEAQFRNNKISIDQTKYDIVVSGLDPKYLDVVAHIIRNPPVENKYETLKTTLISEFQHSDEKRLTQLLQGIDLGDRKPSALLRQMREISKGIVTDNVLETLWSSKLPGTLRAIIASINISLEEKAQTADKILDRSKFETSAATNVAQNLNPTNDFSVNSVDLTAQIAALTKQVENLSKKFNNFSSHSRSRSRSRSSSRFNKNKNSNFNANNENEKKEYEQCWYHFKFNENARNCTDWCKFNADFQKQQKN